MRAIFLALMLLAGPAFAAGSCTVTRSSKQVASNQPLITIVNINCTGDSAAGTVPTYSIPLYGWVHKVVTNPGSTGPSANYDIDFVDAEGTVDLMNGALQNRHTSNTEVVYPAVAGTVGTVSSFHPLAAGNYTYTVTNTSVASATWLTQVYLSSVP